MCDVTYGEEILNFQSHAFIKISKLKKKRQSRMSISYYYIEASVKDL